MQQYGEVKERRRDIGPDGVPEFFSDAVGVRLNPFGSVLVFSRRDASHVGVEGGVDSADAIPAARVRMSMEHVKMLAMIFYKSILNFESEYGVKHDLPDEVLAGSNIDRAQWDAFWGHAPKAVPSAAPVVQEGGNAASQPVSEAPVSAD